MTFLSRRGTRRSPRRLTRRLAPAAVLAVVAGLLLSTSLPAQAANYPRIHGEGSSWAAGAWADWVAQAGTQGVTVDYNPNGSSVGRKDFATQQNAAWADSEIPFTGDASDPQDATRPNFSYGMLPVVAGGTAFMYNLPIGGQQFKGLQLSMQNIADIFSGKVTQWNDPSIATNNPGVALPAHQITVVVRSDGSGATAQFKLWMLRQFPQQYANLAQHTGGDPTHASSYFPTGDFGTCSTGSACFVAANKSDGVTTYTVSNQYTIDYDEYSYALSAGFPVAKVENAAGYYTLPTDKAVAVALTQAIINDNPQDPNYLSQDLSKVYGYQDPRSYPMSMYSYSFVPNQTTAVLSNAGGATLAWLHTNAVCEWQREMGSLGYSPLPMNLVLASLGQILKVPGIDQATKDTIAATQNGVLQGSSNPCNNPTFKPGDDPSHNVLVDTAPFPPGCDSACSDPWKKPGVGTAISDPNAGNGGTGGKSTNGNGGKDSSKSTTGKGGKGGSGHSDDGQIVGDSPSGSPSSKPSDDGQGGTDPTQPNQGGGGSSCTVDPDTGACIGAAVTNGGGGGSDGGTGGDGTQTVATAPVATVVAGQQGWGGPQTVGIVVGIVGVLLLLTPPLTSRMLSRRKEGRR